MLLDAQDVVGRSEDRSRKRCRTPSRPGSPRKPASSEPTASTISGTSIDQGPSWTCLPVSSSMRGLPKKVRKIMRKV